MLTRKTKAIIDEFAIWTMITAFIQSEITSSILSFHFFKQGQPWLGSIALVWFIVQTAALIWSWRRP